MSSLPPEDAGRKLSRQRAAKLAVFAPCGQEPAYYRHLRVGEEPDEACRRAHREGEARRKAARKQKKADGGVAALRHRISVLRDQLTWAEQELAELEAACEHRAAEQADNADTETEQAEVRS